MKPLCVLVAMSCVFGYASAIQRYYMDLNCGNTIDFTDKMMDQMRLKLTSRSSYKSNMDCTLVLRTSYLSMNEHFMIEFKNIDIESSSSCTNDFLEVRDGATSASPYVTGLSGRQCGYYISSTVHTTSGNYLYLRFKSDSTWNQGGFDVVITKYHTGSCFSYEYNCNNGRCIDDSLECNGYNPCGDYSDCPLTSGAIAGIVVGSIFFCCILFITIVVCRRRRLRYMTMGGPQPNTVVVSGANNSYGASGGYNQPVPSSYPAPAYPGTGQQYPPAYPTGQQYPPAYNS